MNKTQIIANAIVDNIDLSDDKQLDYMFDIFYLLMNTGRYDIINEIFGTIDVHKIKSLHALYGLLTSTIPASNRIKNRKKIYEEVKQIFSKTKTKQQMDDLFNKYIE